MVTCTLWFGLLDRVDVFAVLVVVTSWVWLLRFGLCIIVGWWFCVGFGAGFCGCLHVVCCYLWARGGVLFCLFCLLCCGFGLFSLFGCCISRLLRVNAIWLVMLVLHVAVSFVCGCRFVVLVYCGLVVIGLVVGVWF